MCIKGLLSRVEVWGFQRFGGSGLRFRLSLMLDVKSLGGMQMMARSKSGTEVVDDDSDPDVGVRYRDFLTDITSRQIMRPRLQAFPHRTSSSRPTLHPPRPTPSKQNSKISIFVTAMAMVLHGGLGNEYRHGFREEHTGYIGILFPS